MIIYKIDIMEALKEKGYTSYRLRQDKIFGEATMTKFRRKEYINFDNLNLLCELLECQPGDIIEHVKGNQQKDGSLVKDIRVLMSMCAY